MRYSSLFSLVLFLQISAVGWAEESSAIQLATHDRRQDPAVETATVERIRRIVLNQGDDARALANLVQLTRKLPETTTSQLYYDLTTSYLQAGKYDQAANLLQQLIHQFPAQPITSQAVVRLMRLYSSSEVTLTENLRKQRSYNQDQRVGFLKYANQRAGAAIGKNAELAEDWPLTFQRATTTRLYGQKKAAQGRLTQLRHATEAEPWRTRARAEHWLLGDRQDEAPMPVVICRRMTEPPHLDGKLEDSLWRTGETVQLAYDDEFLYVAISAEKVAGLDYTPDPRPRGYDADLTKQDHLRLLLDADRDYATGFELAVDHRGWVHDRCWLDASWNLQWFVAAGGDSSHWTIEAAIPWEPIAVVAPQRGDAWAVAWERVLPGNFEQRQSAETRLPTPGDDFRLLVFE